MLIFPSVSFSSKKHPFVCFCLKLRLWSKPTLDDAEMTVSTIGKLFWYFMAAVTFLISRDHITVLIIVGFTDLIGRMFGIRSSYFFVPLWIICVVLASLFLGVLEFFLA